MEIELGVGLFWKQQTYDDYAALVEECESLGYAYLWPSNEKFFHDMYIQATVIAERTTKPLIGTFVADPYTHHPALTATAIGTLDEVSRGRAVLGIGAGGTGFPPMGIKRVKPARAIKEAIQVIRPLLRGETVDFQGEVIQFKRGRLNFESRPDIPIIVATRGDLVLQVGGEVADGVMIATYAEPVGIQHALKQVEKGAIRGGRSLRDVKLISRVDACISSNRQAAIEAVKPMVGVFLWTSYPDRGFVHRVDLEVPDELEQIIAQRDYNLMEENAHKIPDAFVDKLCWAGTAEEVAHKVAAVVESGVSSITFLPHPPPGGDIHETVREFARTVKPLVEDMTGDGSL
jgi:5,10-methylenetetrahydromethanopterin reductase